LSEPFDLNPLAKNRDFLPFSVRSIILTSRRSRELFCDAENKIVQSQVKLLITNHSFYIVQRATEQSTTGIFRSCGVAEAPPGFQAGWSDSMYFFLSLSVHFVCSSGVNAAQTFVFLRRLNHETF
jgi:hypothetical protein